jgi:hypothetical protein
MYDSDRPFILLYLINVLQPVSAARLRREFEKLTPGRQNRHVTPSLGFAQMMERHSNNRLIFKRKGLYAVTGAGLQAVSAFGLARARDRNRLFLLKELL